MIHGTRYGALPPFGFTSLAMSYPYTGLLSETRQSEMLFKVVIA
jgi:hypothetical protein